jgi:drug/metabolite transporter (DMT)-like permease
LFTALLGIVWLGERMSVRMLVGLLTGFAAVALLVGWSPLDTDLATLVAVAAALGAALSYAFAGTFVRRRLPGVGGTEIATAQLAAGALVLLPFAIATGAPGTPTPTGLLALLMVGTLSTALPWPIFFRLLGSTTATVASSVTFVVPAFAVAWGAIALGETVGLELVAGFAMIIVSLLLVLGLVPSIGFGRLSRVALRRGVSPAA